MAHTTPRLGTATPTAADAAAADSIYRREGLARATEILGVGRHTLERVRGGLPVRRPTLLAVRAAITVAQQRAEEPAQ